MLKLKSINKIFFCLFSLTIKKSPVNMIFIDHTPRVSTIKNTIDSDGVDYIFEAAFKQLVLSCNKKVVSLTGQIEIDAFGIYGIYGKSNSQKAIWFPKEATLKTINEFTSSLLYFEDGVIKLSDDPIKGFTLNRNIAVSERLEDCVNHFNKLKTKQQNKVLRIVKLDEM